MATSDEPRSDRRTIIEWYKLDIDGYREEIRRIERLISHTEGRIRELEILEIEEKGF